MMTDFSETSIWDWDVFLSFRGPNTRHKFTDHLYHNLKEKNIRVFRDAEGIRAGDEISPSLDKAIERSRLSVVIFSKDYASSDSCLDELVTILKCKKERKQRVIPIFYEVKVSELQCHKMDEHEQNYGKDRVKIWTSALKEASTLKGESYHAGYEHEFLEKIINQIMSFLGPNKVLLGELVKTSNEVLDDAENKEITDRDVKLLLDELKDVVYDAEDLLAYHPHAIASDSSSVVAKVRTKVEEKLKEILERLAQRKKEMENLGLGDCGREADVYGTYIDKKCPFTGIVSIWCRILAGTCHSSKMMRTVIVRRNYLHVIKKYQRYDKRHSNIPAHVAPCFRVKEGDHVIIGKCRPLFKTVRFNVLKVIPAGSSAGGKKGLHRHASQHPVSIFSFSSLSPCLVL